MWRVQIYAKNIVNHFVARLAYLILAAIDDDMHSAAYAVVRCVSVRPSVCPSVTFTYQNE